MAVCDTSPQLTLPPFLQKGGLACLQDEGYQQMLDLVAFYKENAAILRCS